MSCYAIRGRAHPGLVNGLSEYILPDSTLLEDVSILMMMSRNVSLFSFIFHLQWKFAFLSLGRPEYLQDSDIVSSRFQVSI